MKIEDRLREDANRWEYCTDDFAFALSDTVDTEREAADTIERMRKLLERVVRPPAAADNDMASWRAEIRAELGRE